ncbi:hypothetical protein [Lacticaseibacillus sp. 866-1]|uniref:hypothetical protein n=1 Tax=Lacticaseibacillus sp. 866-1 TaxID=2799576 RepID=UPI00194540D3|nr:hypothetical protein [Lacticaseibacillus sp. 866-1]
MNNRTIERYYSVDLRQIMHERNKRMMFRFTLPNSPDGFADLNAKTITLHHEQLRLATTRSGFGGQNYFFRCPDCNRRCLLLYLISGSYHCRQCLGLVYKSQQATKTDWTRVYNQAEKLARRIDPSFRFKDYISTFGVIWAMFPTKPKRMHWATYYRLRDRFVCTVEKANKLNGLDMIQAYKNLL